MRDVCRQAAEWETLGLAPKLGMNVSPRQLRRRGFAARLAEEVARHDIAPEPQATEILLGILRIAAATGADVTVEGVETEEQLELLEAHGFHFLQGFLLSRPVPAEQLESALRGTIVPERGR